MSIITLTTDFGLKDHFVGALKGKILSQKSDAKIVDISHHVDAFNIAEASYIIGNAYSHFPEGTIHFIGINAEKTATSNHLVAQINNHFFVCADNGILSLLTQTTHPTKIIAIDSNYISNTNATDLDVLIAVSVHLSNGGSIDKIGNEIENLKQVTELQAIVSNDLSNIKGFVIYIDHFGNAVTNITRKLFQEIVNGRSYEVTFKNKKVKTIFAKYSDYENIENNDKNGTAMCIFNESGFLEVAIYKSNPKSGSANTLLGMNYRDFVIINFL